MPRIGNTRRSKQRLSLRTLMAKWLSLLLASLLAVLMIASWSHAEEPLPAPELWQMKGIMAALDDPDPLVWAEALRKLSEYKLDELKPPVEIPQDKLDKIVGLLAYKDEKDPNVQSRVRMAAAIALGNMGEATKSVVPQIAQLLSHSDVYVRRAAAQTLGHMGEAAKPYAPQVAQLLSHSDVYDRRAAAEALGHMGEAAKPYAPQVAQLLSHSNPDVQIAAAEALGNMGEAAKPYAPQIAQLLSNSDVYVRWAAAEALGHMGQAAKPYSPQVAQLLSDSDSSVRRAAAEALGHMGQAAKSVAPQVAQLLSHSDISVQIGAADALGHMGEAAKPYAPQVAQLLSHSAPGVQSAAADALGNMGEAAKSVVPQIAQLLSHSDVYVRRTAAEALGHMGEAAKPYAPQVAQLLSDSDSSVRMLAAQTLGHMGEAAKPYAPQVAQLLSDSDVYVRSAATEALGHMGQAAKLAVPEVAQLLSHSNPDVQSVAAEALGNMGEAAKLVVPEVAQLLSHSNPDVQSAAAEALGNMGEAAKSVVPQIAQLLSHSNVYVRRTAAEALGNIGQAAKPYAPQVAQLLSDSDSSVRWAAAQTLGNMGEAAKEVAPEVAQLLSHSDNYVRSSVAEALGKIGVSGSKTISEILNAIYSYPSEAPRLRFLAYFLSNAENDSLILIQWLGLPKKYPTNISHKQGVEILKVFAQVWNPSPSLSRLSNELEKQIAVVVNRVEWQREDLPLLQKHYDNLKFVNSTQAEAVNTKIVALQGWQWFSILWTLLLFQLSLWLILLTTYPHSRHIQTLIWHPKLRKLLGFGYIDFLLTSIPPFRHRLLSPFRDSLLADANLYTFDSQAYFPNSHVQIKGATHTQLIQTAIANIQSPIIIEGESGLGKSMFLRHHVKTCKRLAIYLPATQCAAGVIPAIQTKLPLSKHDPNFLKSLIYHNALDICIDGLNEVTPDTRANISSFVDRHFKNRILLTTQPLEWTPPATAKTYILQPLKREQIEQFLISRQAILPEDAPISGVKYEEACQDYLTEILNPKQSKDELTAVRRFLSNPMDLTLVAQLLAQEKEPDLLNLQQQQYQLMATEYQQHHLDPFPLKIFAETVYQMRLNDQITIPDEPWRDELDCMERHKMVLTRQLTNRSGKTYQEWYFRHDKIQEYFIVQTFLGDNNEKPQQHFNDPRFRGVYLLLATLLPVKQARALRELLIQNAAETKDHVVSDQFIQRFKSREQLSIYINIENKAEAMTNSYNSKYDQRNSQNLSFVDTAQNGSKQQFNNTGSVQHNYPSEQKQTLAEAAAEIQGLLKQLEQTNPNATEAEKQAFVNLAIPPTKRQRFVSAMEAGGKEALKELLDNPYVNVGVAIVEGWQNP